MSEADGRVSFERVGATAVVTIDRPAKLNSLTPSMWSELEAAMTEYMDDDRLRAVILTGSGERAFSTGADLESTIPRMIETGQTKADGPDPARRFFSTVYKPIIAAVNGLCIAGGMEMLLGTDLRLAVPSATFALSEVRWGLVPSGGSHVRLPRQVPWSAAMRFMLLGDQVPAERALQIGLIDQIVASEDLLGEAHRLADRLARNSPFAVRKAKEIALKCLDLEPAFRLESELSREVIDSADAKEGIAAFAAKREPRYW